MYKCRTMRSAGRVCYLRTKQSVLSWSYGPHFASSACIQSGFVQNIIAGKNWHEKQETLCKHEILLFFAFYATTHFDHYLLCQQLLKRTCLGCHHLLMQRSRLLLLSHQLQALRLGSLAACDELQMIHNDLRSEHESDAAGNQLLKQALDQCLKTYRNTCRMYFVVCIRSDVKLCTNFVLI